MCADITRTVEIIFGAVDRNTASTINDIEKSFSTFDSGIQGVAEPLGNFTETLLKAEAAVVALAAAYGAFAVNEAIKFQNAQIDLNKVLSDSDPAIGSFTQTVTDLSEQYGISSAAILQGISNFKQAGFAAKDAADLQKVALDLVIAGDVDAARASEILVASLKGFGAEASEASRFVEALNNVSNDYATDVNQLAEGMSRVAPILKIMGFSFEEGTGLLTPIIEVFRDGSEAADALKTGLLKLIDDSKPVTSALAALGVSQFDLNGKMRSGKDIFYDVAAAFQHVDENQKLVFTSQLVGIEQAPKMVAVFNDLAKVNEVTASAMAVTGSVAKEVGLRLDSAEKQVDKFKVGFDNLARVVGGELITGFSGIVGGATEIEVAFRKIVEDGGLAPLFDALGVQMGGFQDALKTIAINLPAAFKNIDFSGLLNALGGLGDELKAAFSQIFGNIDLTTVEGLHNAIQTVINIITSLVNVTKAIVNQFDPIFGAIGEAGKQIGGASDESSAAAGKLLGSMLLLKDFGTALGLVIIVLKESQADITNVFNTIVGGGRLFTNALQLAFDAMALAIVGTLEDLVFAIGHFLDSIGADEAAQRFYNSGNDLKLTADGIKANLASNAADMQDAWDQMSRGLSGGSEDAKKSIDGFGNASQAAKQHLNDMFIAAGDSANALIAFSQKSGEAEGGVNKLSLSTGLTVEQFDKLTAKSTEITAGLGKVKQSSENVIGTFKTLAEAEQFFAENMHGAGNASITYANGLYQINAGTADGIVATKELANATKEVEKSNQSGTEEWKRVQDVMLATQKQTDDYTIKLGELSNKRYEIDVRANVDLKTAEIEADTQRIAAAFQATTQTISDLTASSADLWGLFAGDVSLSKRFELEAAALRNEQRLDEALELQREQVEAIVDKMRAETARLESGEALISIDAGELAPELELVFDKILKYTQIKATQQGLSLLVGL